MMAGNFVELVFIDATALEDVPGTDLVAPRAVAVLEVLARDGDGEFDPVVAL